MKLYKNLGHNFYRKKNMKLVYKELKHFKEVHKVEYMYFWADTFLGMSQKEFDKFCEIYSDIKLPFWIQTRPETVNDYNLKKLKQVGLHRISFGLEHGNEKFRKEVLDRRWKNKDIIAKLQIPKKYGISFSVNNITGFPKETKKLAFDTIEINRDIEISIIQGNSPCPGAKNRCENERQRIYESHLNLTKSLSGDSISQEELLKLINTLNNQNNVNGILVQLPLPNHIHEQTILDSLLKIKEVITVQQVNI